MVYLRFRRRLPSLSTAGLGAGSVYPDVRSGCRFIVVCASGGATLTVVLRVFIEAMGAAVIECVADSLRAVSRGGDVVVAALAPW
jgi:hypothetical protein